VVTDPLALFIALVSFGFFLNYVVISLIKNKAALTQITGQTFALAVYLGILAAGIFG
jgi:NADH:ubiquinone oxidoreductase subunit K